MTWSLFPRVSCLQVFHQSALTVQRLLENRLLNMLTTNELTVDASEFI